MKSWLFVLPWVLVGLAFVTAAANLLREVNVREALVLPLLLLGLAALSWAMKLALGAV